MIKINLTPIEELENPLWWLPDALIVVVAILISYGGVYFYLDLTQRQIDEYKGSAAQIASEINVIQPEVSRYNDLTEKIAKLESKNRSLKRITESKLVRYLPLILLESLQTLKPDGLWFKRVAFVEPQAENPNNPADQNPTTGTNLAEVQGGDYPVSIELVGNAFDNIIIAEFMTSLKATYMQSYEQSDVRTQLYFSDVKLSFAESSAATQDERRILEFQLVLKFRERNETTRNVGERMSELIESIQKWRPTAMR